MAVVDISRPRHTGVPSGDGSPGAGMRARASSSGADAGSGLGARVAFALLGLVLLAYTISVIVRKPDDTSTLIDGWGVAGFEIACSALVILRGVVNQRDRVFGLWLGAGMAAWAAGDVAMTIETLHGATPATLSVANVLWYGFFPLSYIGVMALMRRDVRRFTVANYLDGVVACLLTGALFAAFAFNAIVSASGGDATGAAVNVIYPLGDLLLLVLVALPAWWLPRGTRARWYLIAGACVFNACGDVAALFPGILATHVGVFFNMLAWPASLFFIAAAIWLAPSTTHAPKEETSNGFAIPTLAAGLALLVLFVGSLVHINQVALALASATILGAGIRFGLALRRLRGLTEERHHQLHASAETERETREALQRTVREYSSFAGQVADGDLTATVRADGNEEMLDLAHSLNRMVGGLAEISREIQSGVQDMGASTSDILAAVSTNTRNAAVQSQAIEQTALTITELRGAAEVTSGRAEEVAVRARESLAVSAAGSHAVAEISRAMQEIRDRVDGIARDIVTLSQRTQQIGEITATVNGLADRSNLLALNASIEAARAGEHGRGFAVVAEQVRHLAEQSKLATAQVETILGDIETATAAAVSASSEGTEVVAEGLALADRAGEGIRSLTETIRAASTSAEEIAASVQEQGAGMTQIAAAMQEISAGTSHIVSGAEQSQNAAEKLDELARKLAGITERYRV
jgi:methyl-accepting chemotaxis protein